MSLLELARNRKSTRSLKNPPIEYVLDVIRVALEATSGLNCQPWYFYIVSDKSLKKKIRKSVKTRKNLFMR